MFSLMNIRPAGIAESTVSGLAMYHITHACMEATDMAELGGGYSQTLRGLTPARLISAEVRDILEDDMDRALIIPALADLAVLPRGVGDEPASRLPQNWRY